MMGKCENVTNEIVFVMDYLMEMYNFTIVSFHFLLIKKNILYMGDDNPDIKPLKVVGISSCPKDASVDVKSICDYVSHKKGGYGCVRDVIEQVMRIHGKWI